MSMNMFFFNFAFAKKCCFAGSEKIAVVDNSKRREISGGAYISDGKFWVWNDSEKKQKATLHEIKPE